MTQVDYYFTPQSPWTYLGHARFADIARRAGAEVRVRPVDLGAVFPVSGGLPLGKRAPQVVIEPHRLRAPSLTARPPPVTPCPTLVGGAGGSAVRVGLCLFHP